MPTIKASIKGKGFPVILLHGFCENKSMWYPYAKGLKEKYQIICPDLPGFGESPLSSKAITLEAAADELAAFLLRIEVEKCVIIGHSLGGYVALALAERHPLLVQGLGLFNSTALADDEEAKHRRNKSILFLKKHPVPKFIEPFIPSLFYSKRKEELKQEIALATAVGLQSPLETIIAYTSAMKIRKDRFELWKNLPFQTLFIGGANDSRVPLEVAERHIEARTKVDGYILPETAHMAMHERPTETLQMIHDYLLKVC
ncbi:alpha/beta fold hydrolase [Roseivirga echinicomitans]